MRMGNSPPARPRSFTSLRFVQDDTPRENSSEFALRYANGWISGRIQVWTSGRNSLCDSGSGIGRWPAPCWKVSAPRRYVRLIPQRLSNKCPTRSNPRGRSGHRPPLRGSSNNSACLRSCGPLSRNDFLQATTRALTGANASSLHQRMSLMISWRSLGASMGGLLNWPSLSLW